VFVTGKPFQPNLMFAGKAWSPPRVSTLHYFTLRVGF
jgi:hypothetical protein